ncbi:hypothetical protein PPSIR1_06988 [Plesiocystis pacifica SIR-1]|uniref:VOC domain-containing protein n=1 Tax=Plesiocystis pacifica SIR-1 TaxID=391625 RepID=A6G556_9BACT|nr:VOC family protein [Plesiocystis pacifica]EDM78968.1 hypothetical protein PPSIR1_06988 [Plesiocystis pacifica SIR-1]
MPVPAHCVHYLEIITDDPEGTADFYARAYGWSFAPPDAALGGARVGTLADGSLCGVRAPMHDQERLLVRPYLRVDDIDAAVAKAVALGARLAVEPMPLPGHGRIAIFFLGEIEQGLWEVGE